MVGQGRGGGREDRAGFAPKESGFSAVSPSRL